MLIKSLQLNNYRNYTNYSLEFNPHLNIIIGKNGVGKTNILESIVVVSNSKSFRTLNDKDLILKNSDYLTINLKSNTNIYKVVINQNNKSLYIDDKLIKKTSDYIGKLNAILFKPSDLEMFTCSPSERRKIIDLEIGKVNNKYLKTLLKYNSLLKDKNKTLKDQQPNDTLISIIDEMMIPNIELLISEREKIINNINLNINKYYKKISKTENKIKINYKKCCEINNIKENIINTKEKDNYYHYTTFGPHHEDYYFTIDGYNVNSIASQGQKRMIMIAFKFALIKYIEEYSKTTPILLLDDILSELDKDNQERLLKIIPEELQVIITNTDINDLNIDSEYKLIELKEAQYV